MCTVRQMCAFWPLFSMVRDPPPPAATATIRFAHIMSVVIIPALCKQKCDALRKECQTNQWNECLKFQFFDYIVISPMNYIFKRLVTLLLTTLTWNIRGFGILGYCKATIVNRRLPINHYYVIFFCVWIECQGWCGSCHSSRRNSRPNTKDWRIYSTKAKIIPSLNSETIQITSFVNDCI